MSAPAIPCVQNQELCPKQLSYTKPYSSALTTDYTFQCLAPQLSDLRQRA